METSRPQTFGIDAPVGRSPRRRLTAVAVPALTALAGFTFLLVSPDENFGTTSLPLATGMVGLAIWCALAFGLAAVLVARPAWTSTSRLIAAVACLPPLVVAALETGGLTSLYMLLMPIGVYWVSRWGNAAETIAMLAATLGAIVAVGVLAPHAADREDLAQTLVLMLLIAGLAWSRHLLWKRVRRQSHDMERANATLTRMVRELDRVREKERYDLSARIHDTALQQLIAALLHYDAVVRALEHDEGPVGVAARRSDQLVREAVGALRQVLRGTQPLTLEHSGIAEAVAMLEQELRANFGITVDLQIDLADDQLADETTQTLHRLLLEAITNAAKHADAPTVHVRVHTEHGRVVATVRDEGRGLAREVHMADDVPESEGMGLRLMVERVREVGGSMRIDSSPGKGTTIAFRLPLAPA